jgi:hypothetical protein
MISTVEKIENISFKNMLGALTLALISFYFELHACLEFIWEEKLAQSLLLTHCIILCGITICIIAAIIMNTSIKFYAFILLETAVAGPIGSLIAIMTMLFYLIFTRRQISLEEKFAMLHPKYEQSVSDRVFNEVLWDTPHQSVYTEPFGDIIKYGNIREKQEVLIKIKKYFRPDFAPLLFVAVNDSNNSIRVQAAAIITNIEEKLMISYRKMEKQIAEKKTSPTLIKDFFKKYLEHVETGILDSRKHQGFIKKLIEKMEDYIENNKNDINALVNLGKMYLLINCPEKVLKIFYNIDTNTSYHTPDAIIIYLKAAYLTKQYSLIRTFLIKHKDTIMHKIDNNEEIIAILNTWTNEDE